MYSPVPSLSDITTCIFKVTGKVPFHKYKCNEKAKAKYDRKPEKFETFSSEFSDSWFVLTALRMLILLPLQPQRSRQPVSASLSHTAAAAALGCRESTVMRGQCTVQGGEV
ncbi:hypothetical protein TYRP_015430 [Tyrophagus putrescentiae]|nr:hypothetical protein TYRP_015430 [Tyrophagus putrescentiae]